MKFLRELVETVDYLTEGENKSLYITGPFLVSEEKNRNGRIYPKGVLESSVSKYIENKLNNKTSYGELSHPQGPKINEDRISHLVESLIWDKNIVIGKAKILNTPMGNIARGILEGGGKLGVSSRGLGTLKQNSSGIMEVQDDYFISTAADIVTDPSGPGCLVNGIMENADWIYDESNGWILAEKAHQIKNEINKMSKGELAEKQVQIFNNFINSLLKAK